MNLFNKIAFNTLVSYAGRIAGSIFGLVAIGLMTRSLGQAGFGGYTTAVAYLSLFVIFADMGLQSLMTREISRTEDGAKKIAGNFFTIRLVSSLIFLTAGVSAAFLLPYSAEIKMAIAIGSLGYFFLSSSQLLLGVFQKHLAMHFEAFAQVAGRAVQLALVYIISVVYAGFPIPHILLLFVGAMSIASAVIFVLMVAFARRYVNFKLGFDFTYWKKILKTTWPIALSIVLTLIYFKIDTIFLSLMKPEADVGIYGVAYKILENLIFFPAIFAGIMMPILSRDAVGDPEHFKRVLQRSMRAISIFAMPLVAGGWVLAYSAATIIGGGEFRVSGAPMQPLFIATGIIFFGNILGRAVIALDLQKKAVFIYLFGVLFNVILNLIFIPKYTYMGAAWTTVATELLIMAFLFYLVRKHTGASLDILSMTKAAFSAAVMAGVLLLIAPPLSEPVGFIKLTLFTVLGALIYFSVLFLVKGLSLKEIRG